MDPWTEKGYYSSRKKRIRAHFIWAGDQTEEFGNVLFLEDDLHVSPYVLDYVNAVIDNYSDDMRIAGGALYNPILCEFNGKKFYQVEDGYDNFFFQHPYWGNIWFGEQWKIFKCWLNTYEYKPNILPASVQRWNTTSFKKLYVQFLIETNRFIVYPRISYVTNMGEMGLHSKKTFKQLHTVLQNGHKELKMSSFDSSRSIYDGFFELIPELLKKENPALRDYDFTVDLQGLRERINTEYILTIRNVSNPILTFSDAMRPIEQNVFIGLEGEGIYLAKKIDVVPDKKSFLTSRLIKDICEMNYVLRPRDMVYMALNALNKKER